MGRVFELRAIGSLDGAGVQGRSALHEKLSLCADMRSTRCGAHEKSQRAAT